MSGYLHYVGGEQPAPAPQSPPVAADEEPKKPAPAKKAAAPKE